MKFSDLLKDAVYDIVGYMLPGLISIPFIFLLINNNFHYSSIYSVYFDLNNLKLLLQPFNFQLTYYIPILILSYIVGIFLKYLGILVGKFFSKLLGENFAYNNFFCFFRLKKDTTPSDIMSILIDSSKALIDKYEDFSKDINSENTISNNISNDATNNTINDNMCSNEKFKQLFNNSDFLKEYARTISRFNNHNNLTPKYIAKTNLFNSLSTLFLIEFLNAIVSLFLYAINLYNASQFNWISLLFPFTTSLIFFFLFVFCFIEFVDHKNYQLKENFFYLLENYYKKYTLSSTEITEAIIQD